MASPLRLSFATAEALAREHASSLRKGRAFVAGAAPLPDRTVCSLVIAHPVSGASFSVEAEVVWVAGTPNPGVGVAFLNFDEPRRVALAAFVEGAAHAVEPEPEPAPDASDEDRRVARNLHERVRALSIAERQTLARMGSLPERVALERNFGGSVWEALLANPQLTPPEVARLARNGTLPKPLVQVIVANAGWLAVPEVQRALLGNPRVSGTQLERVIRAVSRADLARIAGLTAYRAEVRSLATKALHGK